MSLGSIFGLGGGSAAAGAAQAQADARLAAWEAALAHGGLPAFVQARLESAGAGRTPWIATMTPSELLLARSHGVRPVATVSGTCWYQYGRSWTEGHAAGWASALHRIKAEAVACGASAIVDVKMRTVQGADGPSMDFTLLGTAVRIGDLPPSPDPVVATVPALEFVRLLEMGVVPVGLAVGARYDWLTDTWGRADGAGSWTNQPLTSLSKFWERVRRAAHQELRKDVARQGTGVLAHTQFGQLLKQEGGEDNPARYLGRHIVIGTVVQTHARDGVPHHIRTVVDMRDDLSPLLGAKLQGGGAYGLNDQEGVI